MERITTVDSTENLSQESREILDVKGAAKILGCSVSHVSNMLNGKVDGVEPIPHVRAEASRVRGDAAGSPDKRLGDNRSHDERRIFLRHADRITGNVFVDDEIANHQHPHARHLGEGGLQARDVELMAFGEIQRLSYYREIRAGIVTL